MIEKARQNISVGVVTEALPNALFRVKFQSPTEIESLAYLSGKMRLNRIKVLIGDSVEVVLDPYGGRGRIVRRLDSSRSTETTKK
jgi:translation initiation factor IF-1